MKNKRIVWLMLSCLMAVALVLASCGPAAVEEEEEGKTVIGEVTEKEGAAVEEEEEEEEVVEAGREMVTDPSTGKLVTVPEYGGKITIADFQDRGEGADACYDINSSAVLNGGVLEKLAIFDWAIDRGKHNFQASENKDVSIRKGALAESWETPDATTIIVHIRQGVYWHNKPPMNGRELTAYDIEYNYHRYLGMGQFSEYEPCQSVFRLGDIPWESIEATDKWTVVFKITEPHIWALVEVLSAEGASFIYPPEVIDLYGDARDWRNQVGTGPFMLIDFVEGSSSTFTKNPNYWGYDEKYPQNRLPYVDELRVLVLPDESTRISALRSGKIDWATSAISNVDIADSLKQRNPEIMLYSFRAGGSRNSFFINTDIPALSDVNVRTAMQMAIPLETINDLYYRGTGFWKPAGPVGTPGWCTPFDEWPEGVKQGYTYDPAGAEALLDAAGYTRGSDGYRFKTEINNPDYADQSYSELVISYWREVGIDAVLEIIPGAEWFMGTVVEKDFHHILWEAGNLAFEDQLLTRSYSGHSMWWATSFIKNDPVYDAIIEAMLAATSLDEYKRHAREADWYAIENHWQIWGVGSPYIQAANPWLKGWNGERVMGPWQTNEVAARLWIDHEMKKAMGH